jgi:hypothetical protein
MLTKDVLPWAQGVSGLRGLDGGPLKQVTTPWTEAVEHG